MPPKQALLSLGMIMSGAGTLLMASNGVIVRAILLSTFINWDEGKVMEPIKNENEGSKIKQQVDRVVIGKTEAQRLDAWIKEANVQSKGFLALSKSDLVNFLI